MSCIFWKKVDISFAFMANRILDRIPKKCPRSKANVIKCSRKDLITKKKKPSKMYFLVQKAVAYLVGRETKRFAFNLVTCSPSLLF